MITVLTADGNTPPKLLKPEQNGRSRNTLYLGGAGESSQMLQMGLRESFCDDMKLRLLGRDEELLVKFGSADGFIHLLLLQRLRKCI
jgi:hypothetical protein